MSKKLITWISCLVISCLLQCLGFMQQGKAFMLISFFISSINAFLVVHNNCPSCKPKPLILAAASSYLIVISITWLISKLFNVNIYLAYEILTLLDCIPNNLKKNT